jgi:hypothetical protein
MSWLNGLSDDDKREMYEDNCSAYQAGYIGYNEFYQCLVKLGYNATDIADAERFYRPNPPENEDDNG